MTKITWIVKVEMAWWWPLYKHGLAFVADLFGCVPNWGKVTVMAYRATRLRLVVIESKAD